MSEYVNHAMREFKAAGFIDSDGKYKDEYQEDICKHILKLLEVLSDEGHSGSSINYTLDVFNKLALFKPLAPLSGEDWEWQEIGKEYKADDKLLYQNKRCSNVFKDDSGAYDIDGIVFWEWYQRNLQEDEEGYPGTKQYKTYYTCKESHVPVTFPYTPTTTYLYRSDDKSQNELGFL
jgi:hypothetical protein